MEDVKPTGTGETPVEIDDTDVDLEALKDERDLAVWQDKTRQTAEQKKHWRKKYQDLVADPRLAPPVEKKEEPKPEPKKPKSGDFDPEAMRSEMLDQLRVEQKYPDMTEAELAKAKAHAKVEGKLLSEVVADEFFQTYMKTNREKTAKEAARPSPSNRNGSSQGFSTDDLADPDKVKNMDSKTYSELVKRKGAR